MTAIHTAYLKAFPLVLKARMQEIEEDFMLAGGSYQASSDELGHATQIRSDMDVGPSL